MEHLHWQHSLAKPSATATPHCTCLGQLGRCDTVRIVSIGQDKWIRHATSYTMFTLNIAIVNTAYITTYYFYSFGPPSYKRQIKKTKQVTSLIIEVKSHLGIIRYFNLCQFFNLINSIYYLLILLPTVKTSQRNILVHLVKFF